ncbi:MAG: hypothetical protein WCJ70_04395 [bacterium]
MQRISEWCTNVWGGGYYLIVPTDRKTIRPEFWTILEKYSPDHIYSYHYTVADLKTANATEYGNIVKSWGDQLKNQYLDMTQETVDEFIEREVENKSRLNNIITQELEQELKNRLSPFYFMDHIVQERVSHKVSVNFPLTDVTKIISHTDVRRVVVPEYKGNKDVELIIESVFGRATPEYEKAMTDQAIKVEHTSPKICIQELVDISVRRKVDLNDYRWKEELRKKPLSMGKKNDFPNEDFFGISPFATSMLKLGYYRKLDDISYTDQDNVLLVIGDTIEDFCLYYSLSRVNTNVHWMPESFMKQAALAVEGKRANKLKAGVAIKIIRAVSAKIRYGTSEEKIHLTSFSVSLEALSSYMEKIKIIFGIADESAKDTIQICESVNEHLNGMLHVIEENNYANNHTVVFIDGKSIDSILTPKPKNFTYINPQILRWITEVIISHYTPPSLHFLGNEILETGHEKAYPTRASRYGICYECPNIGYFGGDIETNTIRPKINLLEPLEIFRKHFAEAGYTDLRISDKGGYASISTEKFGSLDEIGSFLSYEKNRNLLWKFVQQKLPESNEHGEIIEMTDKRKYIDFKAISTALGSDEDAVRLIDSFIEKQIFYRGIPLLCIQCRNTDWHNLDDLGSEYKCGRCGKSQIIKQENWREGNEPKWFYKLDEVVYQGLSNNMHVPLLTLYSLKKESRSRNPSFLYIPEVVLIKGQYKIELDICCIADGRIVIGEAKKETATAAVVDKYANFAKELKKYPDEVIFSTFADDWSEEAKQKISTSIARSRILFRKNLISV